MEEQLVFETNNITEAMLIKGKLESEGIVVLLKGESIGGAYPITSNGWGKIRIYVSKEQFKKAEAILKEDEKTP